MDEETNVPGPESEGAEAAQAETDDTAASEEEETGEDTAAEATDEDEGGEDDEESPKPKKPRGGFQRRISELTANWRSAERDRDYWREMAMKGQTKPPPETQTETQPPKQEDFQDYAAYLDARAEWVAEQKVSQRMQQEREAFRRQQSETKQREAVQTYEGLLADARAKYDDFDDVAFAPDVHVTDQMASAIMDSTHGPDIQYFLGNNPAEAQRIARLSAVGQIREIGKLEAKLSAPPPKKTTSAPPPVKPVTGKGAAPTKVDPDKLPIKEWMKLEREGKLKY